MVEQVVIFGTNELSEIVCNYIDNLYYDEYKLIGFVVDDEYCKNDIFCSKKVFSYTEFKILNKDIKVILTVGYSKMNSIREQIYSRLIVDGYDVINFIDKRAIVNTKKIGKGNIILDGVNIGVNSKIGNGNIFYPNSLLSHHSVMGNFNYLSPSVAIAGCCTIGNKCFFGINSTTKDNISILDETLIGAGAYLSSSTKNIGTTIVPSKSYEIEYREI